MFKILGSKLWRKRERERKKKCWKNGLWNRWTSSRDSRNVRHNVPGTWTMCPIPFGSKPESTVRWWRAERVRCSGVRWLSIIKAYPNPSECISGHVIADNERLLETLCNRSKLSKSSKQSSSAVVIERYSFQLPLSSHLAVFRYGSSQ